MPEKEKPRDEQYDIFMGGHAKGVSSKPMDNAIKEELLNHKKAISKWAKQAVQFKKNNNWG